MSGPRDPGDTGGAWTSTHEHARTLLAERLSEPLDAENAAWLDGHLADCLECRLVDTEYRAAREALKALSAPIPPRDLWARTSAALDRADRRPRRRWTISTASLGGLGRSRGGIGAAIVAVVMVAFLAGSVLLPASPSKIALSSGGPSVASSGAAPATPIAVQRGDVAWFTSSADGGLMLNNSPVEEVCPTTAATPCATLDTESNGVVRVAVTPRSIYASPLRNQVVVLGRKPGSNDLTMYVMTVSSAPRASTQPSATAVPPPSTPPTPPTPSPTVALSPPPSAGSTPTPTSSQSASPVESATPTSSATPEATATPTASIVPLETPSPTAAAVLAIASNLVVVGQAAAYSRDGTWFAFTARSASTTSGSDIYLWRAGDLVAKPITTDGRSVFSGWVGDRLVGSRVELPIVQPAPSSSDGASSASPAGSAVSGAPASSAGSSESPVVPDAATGAGGSAAPASPSEFSASSFLLDPATGFAAPLASSAWRPVVDPSGRLVVYWQGSIAGDPTTGGWTGATGHLVVGSWSALAGAALTAVGPGTPDDSAASTVPGDSAGSSVAPKSSASPAPAAPSPASPGDPGASAGQEGTNPSASDTPVPSVGPLALPADLGSATGVSWDAGWDETGEHLAIWIGNPADPASGRISLVTIDPNVGGILTQGPSLTANPALPGFSLSDGHLAWATPPDTNGSGSRLQVFAWSGPDAGKIDSPPAGATDMVIVVQH